MKSSYRNIEPSRSVKRAVIVFLLLLGATTGSADDRGNTRIVKFATGEAEVESDGGIDHVIVKDLNGTVLSDSRCDSGSFDDYVTFFTKLKEALAREDRKSVVKLVAYPFRVNGPKRLVLRNEESLSKSYDAVFTPRVLEKIRTAEPAALFCQNGAGMLGDGIVWAEVAAGHTAAMALNP